MKSIFTNKINFQFSNVFSGAQSRIGQTSRYKDKFIHFFSEWANTAPTTPQTGSSRMERLRGKGVSKKKLGTIAIAVVGTIIILLMARSLLSGNPSDEKVEIKGASSQTDVSREFTFPLKDSSGEEVSTFKYKIESAELRDEIVVKGQKANAIKGREFLILNIKLTNDYDRQIQINTRDYIRLSVNGNESEWLAPEIHNDPAEVQAISTKNTRLGFPINESDEKLVIQVGEINGEKEKIELKLK